ncbi:MAG TPA: radical SAM protein [Thermoanaerobaculia bacterium]|nr:radical SAM protein [Thermoanaerobaculia bacterium]
MSAVFPETRAERERFMAARRPAKNVLDPRRPYGFFVEDEPAAPGVPVPVATILLTNRECTTRCTMCDLWKNTLDGPTPPGAIPEQIRWALERLPAARRIKLYNAGSFFDRAAVPPEDHAAIAALVRGFERVVVECHPALAGDALLRFRDLLAGPELEVAVGLETANEVALEKINKGMTVEEFEACTRRLVSRGLPVRSFALVGVPFLRKEEWAEATRASIDVSFRAGAEIVSLIPTRLGNGTLEELQRTGDFTPPALSDLERAMEDFFEGEEGQAGATGMLLADLWNARDLPAPACCASARIERLRAMNTFQRNLPLPPSLSPLPCPVCS